MEYDVIHLVRIFRPNIGGMETIVENIVRNQIKEGLKVCVVTTNFTRDVVSKNFNDDCKVFRLMHFKFRNYLFPKEIVTGLNTNVLHVHGMDVFVDFISFFIKAKTKILSPHGGFFHTTQLFFLKKIYFYIFSNMLYKNSNSYCISYNDVDLTKKIVKNAFYMGCGFTPRDFATHGGNEVIIFGRIGTNKRVDLSIKFASTYFSKSIINVVGHDELNLMPNYVNFNNLIYHGVVDDDKFGDLIKNSGFFIFLSEYEGLGMSLIEALDMGLRCIVSKIDSFQFIFNQLDRECAEKFIWLHDFNYENNEIEFNIWLNFSIVQNDRLIIRSKIREIYNWDRVTKILINEL
jgi:alpha-1,3-mannosyltransferase